MDQSVATMDDNYLMIARGLIQRQDYYRARMVLNRIAHHPTAQAWLSKLDEIEPTTTTNAEPLQAIDLPRRLQVILSEHLAPDEVVLWHEQPEPAIYARYLNPDWMLAMFWGMGTILLLFQLYLQFIATSRGITTLFLLQVATPIIFLLAPFIRLPIAQRRATTFHYTITNKGGYIIEKLKVRKVPITAVLSLEIVEERAGFKSLIFYRYSAWWSFIMVKPPIGFLGLADAQNAYDLIKTHWHYR